MQGRVFGGCHLDRRNLVAGAGLDIIELENLPAGARPLGYMYPSTATKPA